MFVKVLKIFNCSSLCNTTLYYFSLKISFVFFSLFNLVMKTLVLSAKNQIDCIVSTMSTVHWKAKFM